MKRTALPTKTYTAIFIDIDDTLLDFQRSSQVALERTCLNLGLPFSKTIFEQFSQIDAGLWEQQRQGTLQVQQVLILRFVAFLDFLESSIEPEKMAAEFQDNLSKSACLISGATVLLSYLSSKYSVYAASNGLYEMQYKRLQVSGLLPYFKELFVSDKVGYEKPAKAFFEYCLQQSKKSPDEVLFVGDSWQADIQGAQQAAIDTCWFVSDSTAMLRLNKGKFKIKELVELLKLV